MRRFPFVLSQKYHSSKIGLINFDSTLFLCLYMDPNILPNLLVCSHLISKPGERRLAMACSKEENLKMIRELSEMICPSHDFKKIPDRRKQYDGRAATACLYMDQSKEYISNLKDPNAKVTCKFFYYSFF